MVLFDTGMLIKLLDARTSRAERTKLRNLLRQLQLEKTQILIPTPALAEFYVKADPKVIAPLKRQSAFVIASFDEKAAIECSISIAEALASGNKKRLQPDASWQKIKFDHQIAAIAKSRGVMTIFSEDHGLRNFARTLGLSAFCVADLPLPATPAA